MNYLDQSDIDFIKNLSHEMKTQDTRCTAQPYGLIVIQEVEEVRPEGFGNRLVATHDTEVFYSFSDLVDHLEGYYGADAVCLGDANNLAELQDTEEANNFDIDILNIEVTNVPKKMDSNFFLTEKSYHEHIRVNGHNMCKPQSFGIHLTRNKEMERLYEIIHKLSDSFEIKDAS